MPSVVGRLLAAMTLPAVILGCASAAPTPDSSTPKHGLVGLRPLPRTVADNKSNHGGPWEGMPTFDAQQGKYPFVAENLDVVKDWLDGDFKTKRLFFEFYWGLSQTRDDLRPEKNLLIKTIHNWEAKGGTIEHILICREYDLAIHRGYPDAKPGPFKEDTRILFAKDVDDIRALFVQAHRQGLIQHANYKLIQMVQHPTFFAEDARVVPILEKMEGIAYECHQFNRHWPLETGRSQPDKVAKGAKWTLAQGKEYIFYFGPIIWKSPGYTEFIERNWLKAYWKAGLPKHDPNMHYYLNLFPHAHGRGRPVGPESDPHSILGFTKWLIEEIKMGQASPEQGAGSGGAVRSKKGACLTTVRGNQDTWYAKIESLNVSWHYSWGPTLPAPEPGNVEFVPMIWGYRGATPEFLKRLEGLAVAPGTTAPAPLLGFNEPDGRDQANLSVEQAMAAWPHLEKTGRRLGSPGAVHADGTWMQDFMKRASDNHHRVDFVCVHWYGSPNVDGFVKHLHKIHALYGKPLWITEFAVADWHAKSREENRYTPEVVQHFMKDVLPRLDALEFVERYAWFSGSEADKALGPSALFKADGSLTELGRIYAAHQAGPGRD